MAQTLYDKLMSAHIVREQDGATLIYIDLQLIHEVTSPQAFEGLALANRKPWRTEANLADRKSTRLNSSHKPISYAAFCLKKKIKKF